MKTILAQNTKIALSNICKLMAAILNFLLITVIFTSLAKEVITSLAKEVMFLVALVCLSVCL